MPRFLYCRRVILLGFLLVFKLAAAQLSSDTLYYTSDWKNTVKDSAQYYRVPLENVGANYKVQDFYISGKPQMVGISSSPDKEIWEGEVTWYKESGAIFQKATYAKGKLEGDFTSFLGKEKLVATYKNNYFISGSRNFKQGRAYQLSKVKGDTIIDIIHDNDPKGIRYEQLSVGNTGTVKTSFYGKNGKLLGNRVQLSNGNYEGINVRYYYSPMRINVINNEKAAYYVAKTVYYPNGQLREIFDEKTLIKTYFDSTGVEIGKATYIKIDDGLRIQKGIHLFFHSESTKDLVGAISTKRSYDDEKLTNEVFYTKEGIVEREVFYEQKEKVLQKSYDIQGALLGEIVYKNWLPHNGIEIIGDKKKVFKDGKLIASESYYPNTTTVFEKTENRTTTYYKENGQVLGTLSLKDDTSYASPFQGTQFYIDREGDINLIQEYNNGVIVKSTSFRKRVLGDKSKQLFKRIEEFEPDGYNRTRELIFYSNGTIQSDIKYKKYDKLTGVFYDQKGNEIGSYDFKGKEGKLYEFFSESNEIKLIEIRKEGRSLLRKEYTYGPNRRYGEINPVLLQDFDINCCATFYTVQGDTIAHVTVKNEKPWNGTLYDKQSRELVTLKEGVKDGSYKRLDYNQNILESGNYVADKKEGIFTIFNRKGALISEEIYKNGELEGLAKYYDGNGTLLSQMEFKSGLPYQGTKILLPNYNGRKTQETFMEGELVKKAVFDPRGKRVIEFANQGLQETTVYFKNSDAKRLMFTLSKTGYVDGEVISYTSDGAIEHTAIFQKGALIDGTVKIVPRSQEREVSYVLLIKSEDTLTFQIFDVKEQKAFEGTEFLNTDSNYRFLNKLGIYRSAIYGSMLF